MRVSPCGVPLRHRLFAPSSERPLELSCRRWLPSLCFTGVSGSVRLALSRLSPRFGRDLSSACRPGKVLILVGCRQDCPVCAAHVMPSPVCVPTMVGLCGVYS